MSAPDRLITRRNFSKLLLGGLASGAAAGGYAWGVEPRRLSITRSVIESPRLAAGLNGLRVAVLSDIHFAPDWQTPELEQAIEAANAAEPDLILLPGDFVTEDPAVLRPLAPLLGKLRARRGVFASIGNHDGWHAGETQVRRAFESAGISFLCNQSTRLNLDGQRLDIVGTDSAWSGHIDAGRAFAGTHPETTLSMAHEPDPFDELGTRSALQVSGHTHGGQCRVPFIGYAPVTVRYGRKYIYGNFADSSGGRLFVTRGLGEVGLRVRFACVPEVAILELKTS